jgi:glycosyltransferase involved in cell wall biosynthesis
MNILIVSAEYHPKFESGVARHSRALGKFLKMKGHEVTAITSNLRNPWGFFQDGHDFSPPWECWVDEVKVMGPRYGGTIYKLAAYGKRRVPFVGKWVSIFFMQLTKLFYAMRVARLLFKIKPDLVVSLPHTMFPVRVASILCRAGKIPFVYLPLLHPDDQTWPKAATQKILNSSQAVIVLTSAEKNYLLQNYAYVEREIFVVGHGSDLQKIFPSTYDLPLVLYLGRLVLYKGLEPLILAMKEVWREEPDAQLVLAGANCSNQDLGELSKFIGEIPEGFRKNVKLFVDISEDEKLELLGTCRCLVLPSLRESFGTVTLEAWAHEKPVVALDTDVMRSIISSDEEGILVAPNDISRLSEALLKLVRDAELARRLGRNGKKKVDSIYNWPCVIDKYLVALQSAVSRGA